MSEIKVNVQKANDSAPEEQMAAKCPADALDEITRAKYFSILSHVPHDYDPSIFVEALQDENGNLRLYVPTRKRLAWFHMDYPNGVVIPDPPEFKGRMVTVKAQAYKTHEDLLRNVPAAVNMATRLVNDKDEYVVDVCVTRAQSRVLRDLGYDLPRDAHIIDGWTPIKRVNADAKLPEDALEASVDMGNFMSKLAPEPTNPVKKPETEAPAAEPKPAETVETEPPAATSKRSSRTRSKASKETPSASPEQPAAAQQDVAAAPNPESVSAPEHPTDTAETNEGTKMPDASTSPQVAPAAETANETSHQVLEGAESDELLQQAMSVFASVEEAGAYTCRLLQKQTVADLTDMRIKFFASKAVSGTCRDEKLGLATYMVAKYRGIAL